MRDISIRKMMEFTTVLQENPNKAYNWICLNSQDLEREELTNIIKELLCGIFYDAKAAHDIILEDAAIELDELYDELYQDL